MRNKGDACLHMAPKQDPHNVVLAVDKVIFHGANDSVDDVEGAETEQPANSRIAADVHQDIPE